MKLPENKNERVKILALIAMGAVLVLYGLAVGVVQPLFKGKKESSEKIVALQEKLQRASLGINRIEVDRTINSNVLSELTSAANQNGMVLRDRLGNFLLGATEIIDAHAREANISGQVVSENGISQVPPRAERTAPAILNIYTVTVRLEAGVRDLLRMLQSLERSNPYLCVSSLSIAVQADKPGKHAVAFEVQWPIWADPKMPQLLQDQLRELASSGSTASSVVSAASATEGGKKASR